MGERVPRVPMRLQPLPDFEPFGQPVIAHGKVRYVGEALAVVLADTPGIAEDALGLIEVDIEPLPAVADRHASAQNTVAAVRGHRAATSRSRSTRCAAMPRRRSRMRPTSGASASAPSGTWRCRWSRAALLAEWDGARGRLTVSGGAKVLFFNRRTLAKQMDLPESAIEIVENDVGGGFGARGEFYPEDFLIPFAARHSGRPVKWTEDRREHLMCVNHAREAECDVEIACARDGTILGLRGHAYVDVGAYMRTNGAVGARNVAQFMSGPVSHPQYRHRRGVAADQQDAGRHLSRARPLRDRFLPRAAVRHGGAGPRARSRRVPAPQPGLAAGDALSDRHHHAVREQGRVRQRRLPRHARSLSRRDRMGEKVEARGQADRRALSRPRRRLLHRGRRRRAEGERAHRARAGWHVIRSMSAHPRSARDSRPRSRRSRPTRSKSRWIAFAASFTAPRPM